MAEQNYRTDRRGRMGYFWSRNRLVLLVALYVVVDSLIGFFLIRQQQVLRSRNVRFRIQSAVQQQLRSLQEGVLRPAMFAALRSAADPAAVNCALNARTCYGLKTLADSLASLTEADYVYLMNRQGRVVFSTRDPQGNSLLHNNYAFRAYFKSALAGKTAFFPALGKTTGKRGIYLSTPVISGKRVAGVLVVKLPVRRLEKIMGRYSFPVFVISPGGTVFASNRFNGEYLRFRFLSTRETSRLLKREGRRFTNAPIVLAKVELNPPWLKWQGKQYRWTTVPLSFNRQTEWRVLLLHPRSMEPGFFEDNPGLVILLLLLVILAFAVFILLVRESLIARRNYQRMRIYFKVVEQNPAAIMVTDKRGRIEYVNPEFAKLTGYAAPDVIGLTPAVLNSGRHDKDFYRELWTTLLQGKQWHGEFINRRRDGEIYVERDAISPVMNGRGEITNFVSIKTNITRQKDFEKTLKFYATKDQLTGVFNRRSGMEQLEYEMGKAREEHTPLTIGYADLDKLKEINDTLGHNQGDRYIQLVANCLGAVLRQSDTIARLGGDEFLLIMPGCPLDRAELIWERIEQQFAGIFAEGKFSRPLSVSCGLKELSPGLDVDEFLEAADREMYRVKQIHHKQK